jgi:hypothetical protein
MRDDLLLHLFKTADVERGQYTVKFFKEGEWREVTIDDRLPCGKSGSNFTLYFHQFFVDRL